MESVDSSLLNRTAQTQEPCKDVPFLQRKRYFVTFMVFFGTVLLSVLRANLSIAIVDMTTQKNITDSHGTHIQEAEFEWTSAEKDLLLGCTSMFGVLGFIGGFLSCRYGGVRVYGLTLFINGVLTIVSPLTAYFGVLIYSIFRMFEGLCSAISFVSLLQIFVRWSPASEKFRMTDYSLSGFYTGVILVFPVSGIILENWKWSYVFYFSGAITVIWYVIWVIFIYNDPLEDKFISADEQRYIVENVDVTMAKPRNYPWVKILSSKAVLAYLNERFVEAWSFSFAIDFLPLYIHDTFNVSMSQVGLISSLPNLCNLLGMIVGAQIADVLLNRKILSTSKVYTSMITTSQIACIIIFVTMGLWDNYLGYIICICILRFVYGCAGSAYSVLPLDIAGEYASIVSGFGTSVFNVGLILNPIFISFVVPNHNLIEWSRYFLLLSVLNVWGAIIFFFCGSGQPEPWSTARKRIILT